MNPKQIICKHFVPKSSCLEPLILYDDYTSEDFSYKEFLQHNPKKRFRKIWDLSTNPFISYDAYITEQYVSTDLTRILRSGKFADNHLQRKLGIHKSRESSENHRLNGIHKIIAQFILEVEVVTHLYVGLTKTDFSTPLYIHPLLCHVKSINWVGRKNRKFPVAIIITANEEDAKRTYEFVTNKNPINRRFSTVVVKTMHQGFVIGKSLLPDENIDERLRDAVDVLIGSSTDILNYLMRNRSDSIEIRSSLRFVVVEQAERLGVDETFSLAVEQMFSSHLLDEENMLLSCIFFGKSYHNLKYSLNFTSNFLSRRVMRCFDSVMYKKLFQYIRVHKIDTPQQIRRRLHKESLLKMFPSEFGEIDESVFHDVVEQELTDEEAFLYSQTLIKFNILHAIFEHVEDLRRKNMTGDRAEKFLIITKNAHSACCLASLLTSYRTGSKIGLLTSDDDEDKIDEINFAFRGSGVNICVVDEASLHDISRGIVDTVIFAELPDQRVFGTVMEEEMSRLIVARNSMLLKVHILFDVETDVPYAEKIVKFLLKNDQQIPTFMSDMYAEYTKRKAGRGNINEENIPNSG